MLGGFFGSHFGKFAEHVDPVVAGTSGGDPDSLLYALCISRSMESKEKVGCMEEICQLICYWIFLFPFPKMQIDDIFNNEIFFQ